MVCHIDVETISLVDLKKLGAFKYAADPSTKVIIFCYAFNNGPVRTWLPETEKIPHDLNDHIRAGKHCLAWNSAFEKVILKECLGLRANFGCSMAGAAYQSYPLALDKAADAVGLPIGKDKIGNALMKRMCKPRSHEAGREPEWWHETDPEKFLRLQAYCRMDVVVERSIHQKINGGLPTSEAHVWIADQIMNEVGVRLDRDLVRKLQRIVDHEQRRLDNEMNIVTHGVVTRCSQVAKLKTWIKDASGITCGSLDKDGIKHLLDNTGSRAGTIRTPIFVCSALLLRQEAAKSSTAKLNAMWNCASDKDDRMRGLIQYYGAMRTGRFAGRLAQPHNYPRPDIDDVDNAIAYIKAGMTVEGVRMFWGSPMSVVSSCLRGCFVPTKNHDFLSVDFKQIEARVLAWLTGQLDVLQVFADGEDVYVHAAKKVGSTDRFLGKVLTLACGYGMGGSKFQETAQKQGLDMGAGAAQAAVDKWREVNGHIVAGWAELESDCKRLCTHVSNGSKPFNGKLTLEFSGNGPVLIITLPSGRELFYQDAKLVTGRFGAPSISYMGVNSYTKKWERIETYGGKLIENVVQAIARDLLTHAMMKLRDIGVNGLVLTVHDELLLEIEKKWDKKSIDKILKTVTDVPGWGQGIPLACDWWIGDRYCK